MCVRESLIGIDQPDIWRRTLEGLDHGYWHTWEACHAAHLNSGLPTYLYACDDAHTGTRGACPFSERGEPGAVDVFTPTGFSGFASNGPCTPDLSTAWADFVGRRGYICGYFALHPRTSNTTWHRAVSSTNELYFLDLSRGADAALARADRSVRRSIRDFDDSGRQFVTDREVLTDFLVAQHGEFMAARNASSAARLSDDSLHAMCADPNLLIAGVSDGEGICAVHTFAVTLRGAECHLNVWVKGGREFTTPLLAWGIRELASTGVHWLNMGGGVRSGDAIAKAKEKFKAERLPLNAAREIYLPQQYEALCAGNAGEPAQYFPSYRSPGRSS
jgi:hypothetical protein